MSPLCWRARNYRKKLALTFVSDLKAYVRVAFVSGEEEVEVVAGADEELGHLSPIIDTDQRGRVGPAIPHLQGVVIHLCLKSERDAGICL